MSRDYVCIGGHDLDNGFRSIRLLDPFGDNWTTASKFMVGEIWNIEYRKMNNKPPHVEDVRVDDFQALGAKCNLRALVLEHALPWTGSPEMVFERLVRRTAAGTAYIPATGIPPSCSTGYWLPGDDLLRELIREKPKFLFRQRDTRWWMTWVGVANPPERITKGSLVRLSLSRLFRSETAPEGYYVQISGVVG